MNQTEVKRIRFKTDKHIIQYKTPPAWTKIRSFVSRKKAFRKRTGYIYFTWKYPRLEKINKAFKKAGLPTWHLERTGMLYVLVKDGEQYTNPENRRNLWKSYKGFKTDKKEALTYPYLAREILVNNHHYYAHWLLDKKLYKQAKVQIEKSTFLGYDMYYLLHNASYIYFEMYKKSVKDLRPQKEHLNNAFKHINRAVNINKKPAVHLIFRSKIHKSSGDLQKAKADLKKAMDLGSKKAEKLLNKMK